MFRPLCLLSRSLHHTPTPLATSTQGDTVPLTLTSVPRLDGFLPNWTCLYTIWQVKFDLQFWTVFKYSIWNYC